MNDDELAALHDVIQFALWGTVDTSGQSRASFISAVKAGTSIVSIMDGWRTNPQYAAWQSFLSFGAEDLKIIRALIANSKQQVATLKGLLG